MSDNLTKLLFRRLGRAESRMIYHSVISGNRLQYEMAAIERNVLVSKLRMYR